MGLWTISERFVDARWYRHSHCDGAAGRPYVNRRPTRSCVTLDDHTSLASIGSALERSSVLRELLRGPAQLLATLLGLALLVALGLLVAISWRGMQRLEPLGQHLEQQARLRSIDRALQALLVHPDTAALDQTKLSDLRGKVAKLLQTGEFSDPTAPGRLGELLQTLGGEPVSRNDVDAARAQIAAVLDGEMTARQLALSTFKNNAKVELILAAGALLVLPGTALLVLVVLRERISRPLRDLNDLLALIGEGRRRPASLGNVGVPLRPIMESYNRLVEQLAAALTENQRHQAHLESEVRAATEVLFRQQLQLAEADRLAAVGEVSARVAHELRNPLAGIQMALTNLKEEGGAPDQRERLELVTDEVARMTRLLDQLLVRPNRKPEPCQNIEVRALVSELLAMLRYQIPSRLNLENDVDPTVRCWLQRDVVRQVLLNLLLNSAQAIGEQAGTIEVTAIEGGNTLRLCVLDDGPGFPPEILQHGPNPFHTTRSGGMGLGLSTVQRMARAMSGRLELANRDPVGAVATLIVDTRRKE
jgi:two-component system, NtrC family, sensor kinase